MFENTTKNDSRWRGLWPEVEDLETARSATRQGMWAALFVAVLTAMAAATGLLGASASAFIDAFLFGLIAFGIYRVSRVAAVAGLLLFVVERVVMFVETSRTGGIVSIFLLLAFVHGVRGAFAYRRLLKLNTIAATFE